MDTNHVREFLVFCQSMNYSVAARDLFCSRSALRQHIADLADELQVPLVETTPAGQKLTVFGQRFRLEMGRIIASLDEVCADIADMRKNLLEVTVSSASLAWLRGILFKARSNILEAHPEKQIQINTVIGTMTSPKALTDGGSDIAVFRVNTGASARSEVELPEGCRAFKLANDRIRYFAGEGHPICSLPRITREDMAGRRLLLTPDIYESYQRHRNDELCVIPADMEIVTRDFTDYQEYYAGSFEDVIGTVPERFLERYGFHERTDLRLLDIEDFDLRSDFYAACTREFLENPNGRMLFDEMEALAAAQFS